MPRRPTGTCLTRPNSPGTRPVNLQSLHPSHFFQNGAKSGFEMCCGPSTLGAGAKTRLESRIKEFTPHCVCRPLVSKTWAGCTSPTDAATSTTRYAVFMFLCVWCFGGRSARETVPSNERCRNINHQVFCFFKYGVWCFGGRPFRDSGRPARETVPSNETCPVVSLKRDSA